jgi:hypothetical protein
MPNGYDEKPERVIGLMLVSSALFVALVLWSLGCSTVRRIDRAADNVADAAVVVRQAAACAAAEIPRMADSAVETLASLRTTQRILAKYAMHRADQATPWLRWIAAGFIAYLVGHTISEVWKWRSRQRNGKAKR